MKIEIAKTSSLGYSLGSIKFEGDLCAELLEQSLKAML
jgi:hypothetical protein